MCRQSDNRRRHWAGCTLASSLPQGEGPGLEILHANLHFDGFWRRLYIITFCWGRKDSLALVVLFYGSPVFPGIDAFVGQTRHQPNTSAIRLRILYKNLRRPHELSA